MKCDIKDFWRDGKAEKVKRAKVHLSYEICIHLASVPYHTIFNT
jgi:hypothetical protein